MDLLNNIPGVPKTGWQWITMRDYGAGNYIQCNFCGCKKVRYAHILRHPQYPGEYIAGGECCIKLQALSSGEVSKIETEFKGYCTSRDYFIKKEWQTTPKGNKRKTYRKIPVQINTSPSGEMAVICGNYYIDRCGGKPITSQTIAQVIAYEWISSKTDKTNWNIYLPHCTKSKWKD